jgi:hypothetical protein
MAARSTRVIAHRPRGRNDDVDDELREQRRTPRQSWHGVGPRTTSEDVRPRPSVLHGWLWNNSVPVQPESTLLDSFEFIDVAATSTLFPTSATLRRLTVRVSPLTRSRAGGGVTTTPNTGSRTCPSEVK